MVGQITLYIGAAAPDGFFLCDGAQYVTATYPLLSALCNGATNFNVPDLRGRMPIGVNATPYTLLSTGGAATHTLTVGEMPAHSHDLNIYSENSNQASQTGTITNELKSKPLTHYQPEIPSVIGNTGGGAAFNTVPPYLAVNYIIEHD